jgi:hypothetical protein
MPIPGVLIFLAIVVYGASCMGRRALTWVAILFVSGCLVYVASFIVAVALEGIAHDQVRDAHWARETIEGFKALQEAAPDGKVDYERLMGRPDFQAAQARIARLRRETKEALDRRAQASTDTAPADLMQEYLRLEQQQATQADLDAFSARHFPARRAPRP